MTSQDLALSKGGVSQDLAISKGGAWSISMHAYMRIYCRQIMCLTSENDCLANNIPAKPPGLNFPGYYSTGPYVYSRSERA